VTDHRSYEHMREEIAQLNSQIEQTEDPRSGMALVQARIKQLKSAGREIPDDLIRMERNLKADCICQSRGG